MALKDLTEKSATKPKLLPVTEDIIKLKKFAEKAAEEAYAKLKLSRAIDTYKTLAETTLVLTILHNRKRVGDIQYLDLKSYKEHNKAQEISHYHQTELISSLTANKKLLTKHYKKIVSIGKESRAVAILIPKILQKFFATILEIRLNAVWFPEENTFFFT